MSTSTNALEVSRPDSVRPEDTIIAVIGPTGTGKSSFVQAVTNAAIDIGHGLPSCTTSIGVFELQSLSQSNGRVFIVDTPGFDGSNQSDAQTLEHIATWLSETYHNQIRLGGILYFHRISDNRMSGSSLKSIKMLERLIGDKFKTVALVTTMWDEVDEELGLQRERELQTIYWKPLMKRGSSLQRFSGTRDSAITILQPLIHNAPRSLALLVQEEIEKGLALQQTTVGFGLELGYSNILQDHERLCSTIQTTLKTSTPPDDQLREWLGECRQMYARIQEIHATGIPFSRRSTWTRLQTKLSVRSTSESRGPEIRMQDITPQDQVILVLGQTGAGRSSFICDCSGYDRRNIGHSLESLTKEIKIIRAPTEPGKPGLVFVDTPGFDNSDQLTLPDAVVQQMISEWCTALRKKHIRPKGILYLFDITNNFRPESYAAIWALHKVAMPVNLVIASTMWEEGDEFVFKEDDLKQGKWRPMIQAGATTHRIWDNERPAVNRRIVEMLTHS